MSGIEYRRLGRTGLKVSPLCLGQVRLFSDKALEESHLLVFGSLAGPTRFGLPHLLQGRLNIGDKT